MRNKLAVLGLLTLVASAAHAEKRMTVAQLQEMLQAASSTHRTDADVARELAGAAVSERISPLTLQKLQHASLGPKSIEALRVVADGSVFLPLPANEIPNRAAPDLATQKVIMGLAVNYVVRTVPLLPNLMATRVTEHFADLPDTGRPADAFVSGGLYELGVMHKTITYRDGRETDDPVEQALSEVRSGRKSYVTTGLTSWGEFGPILSLVLLDAAKSKLGWARWESWDGKPAAVFQFSVDRAISHYTLQYRKSGPGERVDSHYATRDDGASAGMTKDDNPSLVRETAGYHGTFTVDPETGMIHQIEIQANLASDDILRRADIVVQYGPVQIADKTYICPIHSLAISAALEPHQSDPTAPIVTVKELQLNDVTFTNYRRFGSEATLVMNASDEDKTGSGAGESGEEVTSNSPAPAPLPATSTVPQPAASMTEATPAPAAPPSPALPSPAAPAETQEMSISAADSFPDALTGDTVKSGSSGASSESGFTLQVTTRLVDIGLVATDKRGKPITDLTLNEIEVYDSGRRQQVASFGHAEQQTSAAAAPPQRTDVFTNAAPASPTVENAPDLLILLMDESHLPFNDLNRARGEVLRFIKAAKPDARLAIYSISEHGFRVLQDVTTDHALAENKLAKWTPSAAGASQAAELDQRNREQFDTVRNPEDLNLVNGNNIEVPDYINSADPQLRQLGDNPLGLVLISMTALARHFGPVPGHKTLVWISGDSALYDWRDKQPSIERTVQNFDAAINRTRDVLNDAHISLYAVDASMMSFSGAAVDASLANPQVQLNPVATANSRPGGSGTDRLNQTGRMTAEMQADTHDIQPPVRLLAESTGGRAINKGSDLEKTLDSITQESAALYEIAFHPDMPADNKFHALQLKVNGRKDVRLRYRSGYMYGEEATTAKERFQEAVWRPQDLNGIQLTAEAVKAADAPSGKPTIRLRIAFPGLGLKEQSQGPEAGRWTDNLYIFLAQRDDGVKKAQVSGDTLQLALKPVTYDTGMPTGIPYQREVETLSKLGSIRVVVVDANTGRIGSVTLPSSALQP
jgi:VWFA-related protein